MKDSLVSIIVPIYNVEKYLDKCLLSIKEQSYSNIEVIMVNDGSKDASRNIAHKYQIQDIRFKLFDKENGGLSSGRNYGMRHASGDFICFVDSDDFLAPDYVKTLLNGFDEDTDIVVGDYAIFNNTNGKAYLHGSQYNPGKYTTLVEKTNLITALLAGQSIMSVWKNMYRASFLKQKKLEFVSERIVYAEDKLFHVEAYTLARSVKIIPDIIFFHLVIPGSLSQGYRKNYFEMSKELFYRIEKLLKKYYKDSVLDYYYSRIPNIIGASMLLLCKCGYRESKQNIEKILDDSFVQDAYKKKYLRSGFFRYWILYKIGSFGSSNLVVVIAKLMLLSNPVYRFFQRKKEYANV